MIFICKEDIVNVNTKAHSCIREVVKHIKKVPAIICCKGTHIYKRNSKNYNTILGYNGNVYCLY